MADLVNTLKQFNRKERYWLLRNALGKNCEQLDEEFREALSQLVGIKIPTDAWWAMDYHLDWLVGALHLLKGRALGDPQKNNSLVTGTQEDMDLVIAFADTLILIEAKADTSWSNSQLNSKVDRLIQIIGGENNLPAGLTLRFVLMSPKRSEQLKRNSGEPWPKWMVDGNNQPLHYPLVMVSGGDGGQFMKVIRSDEKGAPNKDGKHWTVST